MNRSKHFITNLVLTLAVSVIGSFFMMVFDHGGARWLKFVLYFGCFIALMSPFFFSSSSSCSLIFKSPRKRS